MMSFHFQDENLKTLVQNLGHNDWKAIASFFPVSEGLMLKFELS